VNKIYSHKLSAEQNEACCKLEALLGFPPACLEDLDAGHLTVKEFWRMNVMVAPEDIYARVQGIDFPATE
jgi:hypothetical protein